MRAIDPGVRAIDPSAFMCVHLSFERWSRGNLLHSSRHVLRLGNLQFPHSQTDSPKQVASVCLCCARKGVAQNRWLPNACAFLWSVLGGNLLRVCSLFFCRQTSPPRRWLRDGEKGEAGPLCHIHVMKMLFIAKVFGVGNLPNALCFLISLECLRPPQEGGVERCTY